MRNFDYRWRLTMPQIELMMADLPHTLFRKKGGKPKVSDVEEAERRMREAYEKKRKGEREDLTVEDIFGGKDLDV